MPLDSEGKKHVNRPGYTWAIWTLVAFVENSKIAGGLWARLQCSLHSPCLCMLCLCSRQTTRDKFLLKEKVEVPHIHPEHHLIKQELGNLE